MQFSCESAQLAKAVNTVKKAISSSPNAPIFSGIHMSLNGNTLELVAMDVNFSMKKVLEVNGNEDGVILVPAQSLGDPFGQVFYGHSHVDPKRRHPGTDAY